MFHRRSLRFKINLSIAFTLILITGVFGTALAIYEIQRRNEALSQIRMTLTDLTRQYSQQLGNEIFAGQVMAVRATLEELLARKNVLAITTYDEFGDLLVSTDPGDREALSAKQMEDLQVGPNTLRGRWRGQAVFDFTSQITAFGENVGFWRIHYSLSTMNRQTVEIISLFATLIVSLSLLIGVLLNKILVRFVLNPVYTLRNAMMRIQGDGSQARQVEPRRLEKMIQAFGDHSDDLEHCSAMGDEIGSLADSFRQMMRSLKNAYIGITTDVLTGLNNRRRLDEALVYEVNRSQRYPGTFSIMMLDIDKFKHVNDTYGHPAGDVVLKQVAALLKGGMRKSDIPGRWGGEEFLVLLPQQGVGDACRLAEKLREAIAKKRFPGVGTVTASFGIAEYRSDESVEDLVKRADEALYKAKSLGRNRVESESPLPGVSPILSGMQYARAR